MAAQVNPDLQRERNKATFDPLELTYALDGCEEFTQRRRELGKSKINEDKYLCLMNVRAKVSFNTPDIWGAPYSKTALYNQIV